MLIATRFIKKTLCEEKMSNTSERVKKIVVEHLGVEKDKVVESASFVDLAELLLYEHCFLTAIRSEGHCLIPGCRCRVWSHRASPLLFGHLRSVFCPLDHFSLPKQSQNNLGAC